MAEDLESKAIAMKKSEIMKDMAGVFDEIEKREMVDVPESVFKSKFLNTTKPGLNPTSVADFARVAGSYYRGVNVVDDTTGEKLFETPPIIEYPDIESISDVKNVDMGSIVNKTNSDMTDGKKVTALDKHIKVTADPILDKVKEASEKSKLGWKLIHEKYSKGEDFTDEDDSNKDDEIDYS